MGIVEQLISNNPNNMIDMELLSILGIIKSDQSGGSQPAKHRDVINTNGGFHKWGTPKWMVYKGKSH